MKKTLLSASAILRTLWPTRAPVVEFFNADEIQISTRLYANKSSALLPSHTVTVTQDMTGSHLGDGTQDIGYSSDELLDIPGDITGRRYIEIRSTEPKGGNYVQFSTATGGSFAAAVHNELPGGSSILLCIPSGASIYAKANTASVRVQWRACQV